MRLRRPGGEVAYQIAGEGPTVLLLHAFPFDRRMWRSTAASLSPRYRVISVDLGGFGGSLRAGAASLADFADDAAAVLDAVGAPMAAVVGLSMGGYVALALAGHHPARLAALVLADTRAGADADAVRRGRDEGIATVGAHGVEAFVAPMADRLLAPSASPSLRAEVLAMMKSQSAPAIAHALAALRDRPDRSRELASIGCPALVLVGAEDRLTPPSEARAMAAQVPGARFVELAGAGHLSCLEAPGAFEAALAEFLDEVFPD